MNQICLAISQTLKDRNSLVVFAVVALMLLGLFIAMPIFTIPGNTLQFRLKTFRAQDYTLMLFLSILAGLNVALYLFNFRQRKENKVASHAVAGGTASSIAGIFGAVIGTATCASCLVALFGLIGLGAGSALFVLRNQSYFLIGTIAIMLVSFYFGSRKVNRICNSC